MTVLDVNDNMPVFGCVEYVTSVQENTPCESIARVCDVVCDVVCVCGGGGCDMWCMVNVCT